MRELREEVREDKVLYYNMNTFYNWINHVLNEDLIDVVAQGSSQDQREGMWMFIKIQKQHNRWFYHLFKKSFYIII